MVTLKPAAGNWDSVICPLKAESAGTCPAVAVPLMSVNAGCVRVKAPVAAS